MAIVFENSQKGTLSSSPSTVTLPQTTAAHDCIVFCMNMAGTAATTVSGAGAVWTQAVNENPFGPQCDIWVGYGCTAGQTTITVTFAGSEGAYCLGMFSGCAFNSSPVSSAAGSTSSGGTVNTLTTASLTYVTGQLVVAACATTITAAWSATTWLHGVTTNSLGAQINGSTRACAADYFIAASGNSNQATYTWTGTANGAQAGIVVLSPPGANQGNMLAVL